MPPLPACRPSKLPWPLDRDRPNISSEVQKTWQSSLIATPFRHLDVPVVEASKAQRWQRWPLTCYMGEPAGRVRTATDIISRRLLEGVEFLAGCWAVGGFAGSLIPAVR